MNTFEITTVTTVEASTREDAEEFLIELYESDPSVVEWHIVPSEATVDR